MIVLCYWMSGNIKWIVQVLLMWATQDKLTAYFWGFRTLCLKAKSSVLRSEMCCTFQVWGANEKLLFQQSSSCSMWHLNFYLEILQIKCWMSKRHIRCFKSQDQMLINVVAGLLTDLWTEKNNNSRVTPKLYL